ncbi:growth hormone secretagogue receptor type 1 [Biomphalaria pfeifferi]|uniref:Growth hormone secretagogue receptor type 1 n=1 Tax=Biomphalaria pfeifferi TaxID=112525 RepID=A0AAD8BAY2_BIOPF|nr:growth hormone secretagogue receptor type 1 [Biomphalaria pfeifferi]
MASRQNSSMLNLGSHSTWKDNADNGLMLSDTARNVFILVNHGVIGTLMCLFGTVGNCLSFAVFLRQGLRMSMNLSLFSISVSDFLGLVLQIWHNFCLNPYVEQIESPLDFMQIQYLTAGWPNVTAVRITGWTTAFTTLKRCLSIAMSLKIKQVQWNAIYYHCDLRTECDCPNTALPVSLPGLVP